MKEYDNKKYQIVQDRVCWLAGEENALGRFLKEHGKSDKTKAGKMMIGGCKFCTHCNSNMVALSISNFIGNMIMWILFQLLGRR